MELIKKISLGVGLAGILGLSVYSYTLLPKPSEIYHQEINMKSYTNYMIIEQKLYHYQLIPRPNIPTNQIQQTNERRYYDKI